MTDVDWALKVWDNNIRRPDHNVEANPDVARAVITMLTKAAELDPTPPHQTVLEFMPGQPPEYVADVIDYLVAQIALAGSSDTTQLQAAALEIEIRHAREQEERDL